MNLNMLLQQEKPCAHGKKVYLLTRELKEKTSKLQKRISGNPDALLLARSSHPVEKFQAPPLKNF